MPTTAPRYTAAEVRALPDDRLRHEVVGGQLFVTPAPGTGHQRVVRDLTVRIQTYLVEHALGEALAAPYEVEFSADTAVQPDILVILADQARHLSPERLYGPPALVVEVVSDSSKRTDRLQKRDLYLTQGVTEYWIVDPDARRVERWRPGAAEPDLLFDEIRWTPSSNLQSLVIDLRALFAEATR